MTEITPSDIFNKTKIVEFFVFLNKNLKKNRKKVDDLPKNLQNVPTHQNTPEGMLEWLKQLYQAKKLSWLFDNGLFNAKDLRELVTVKKIPGSILSEAESNKIKLKHIIINTIRYGFIEKEEVKKIHSGGAISKQEKSSIKANSQKWLSPLNTEWRIKFDMAIEMSLEVGGWKLNELKWFLDIAKHQPKKIETFKKFNNILAEKNINPNVKFDKEQINTYKNSSKLRGIDSEKTKYIIISMFQYAYYLSNVYPSSPESFYIIGFLIGRYYDELTTEDGKLLTTKEYQNIIGKEIEMISRRDIKSLKLFSPKSSIQFMSVVTTKPKEAPLPSIKEIREASRKSQRSRSRSPIRESSPVKSRSRSPPREPSPVKSRSRSPPREPSSVKSRSRSPIREPSPVKSRSITEYSYKELRDICMANKDKGIICAGTKIVLYNNLKKLGLLGEEVRTLTRKSSPKKKSPKEKETKKEYSYKELRDICMANKEKYNITCAAKKTVLYNKLKKLGLLDEDARTLTRKSSPKKKSPRKAPRRKPSPMRSPKGKEKAISVSSKQYLEEEGILNDLKKYRRSKDAIIEYGNTSHKIPEALQSKKLNVSRFDAVDETLIENEMDLYNISYNSKESRKILREKLENFTQRDILNRLNFVLSNRCGSLQHEDVLNKLYDDLKGNFKDFTNLNSHNKCIVLGHEYVKEKYIERLREYKITDFGLKLFNTIMPTPRLYDKKFFYDSKDQLTIGDIVDSLIEQDDEGYYINEVDIKAFIYAFSDIHIELLSLMEAYGDANILAKEFTILFETLRNLPIEMKNQDMIPNEVARSFISEIADEVRETFE